MTTDPVETLRDAFRLELDLAYGPDPHNAVVARALIEVAALDSLVAERDRLQQHNEALYQQWLDVQAADNAWERYGIGCHQKWLVERAENARLREALGDCIYDAEVGRDGEGVAHMLHRVVATAREALGVR